MLRSYACGNILFPNIIHCKYLLWWTILSQIGEGLHGRTLVANPGQLQQLF